MKMIKHETDCIMASFDYKIQSETTTYSLYMKIYILLEIIKFYKIREIVK